MVKETAHSAAIQAAYKVMTDEGRNSNPPLVPDCRTCEHYRPSDMTCAKAICIKGSKYIESPRVVLWRT